MNKPFVFGVATASYQIEGAACEGGRAASIWDTFCRETGRVQNGEDGSTACDHYHRYREDIALMGELGIDSYRFSIAWPRIYPAPHQYNPEGMQFYRDVLRELKMRGIRAAVTLYHWDLPQWAQDLGGWENRDCAGWFVEYATRCFDELGDLVERWITHNEPWCASFLSNLEGEHAPGNTDVEKALRVAHHILISHGETVSAFRRKSGKGEIGITLNLTPVYAQGSDFRDQLALAAEDGYKNRWFLDPIFRGRYPQDMAALFAARCATDFDFIHDGDLEIIAAPIDFLGINFYTHSIACYSPVAALLHREGATDLPKTDMGWDVCPHTMFDLIQRVRMDYTDIPIFITENGSAWKDHMEDGVVNDPQRTKYLLDHLAVVEQCNEKGLGIAGYYYWSFLDNFEWAKGYSKRFGLVHVNYESQKRIPKGSFYSYRDYITGYKGG